MCVGIERQSSPPSRSFRFSELERESIAVGGCVSNVAEELKLWGFEDYAIKARTLNGDSMG
jgi:hypothetical protein